MYDTKTTSGGSLSGKSEIIEKYTKLVPNEIIDLWSNYGFGTFMQGYFKIVNPEEFKEILGESSQGIQGFGCFVCYRYG
ncbi:GAD-like domain-containing protein [Bacillus sp. OV322]|nr:GAD-like domain-containing protein [Bacillus sp. OV322]